jgi:hypothetical protein
LRHSSLSPPRLLLLPFSRVLSRGVCYEKEEEGEKKVMMKLGNNKYCPQLSPPKPNPHHKRGKAKTVELSKSPQVTFLINVSIEVARKCHGIASST